MTSNISSIHDGTRYRIKDREKAAIFQEICTNPDASRKNISKKLNMRPTSVSLAVQELIDDWLVKQGNTKSPGMPGRPEFLLNPNYNRFVAITLYVQARELTGALVNLGEEVLEEKMLFIPEDATKESFLKRCLELIASLSTRIPGKADLLGLGISLIGTVNQRNKIWISSSRWPNIRNLDFKELEKETGLPISLRRSNDTELEYLIETNSSYRKANIILFHWGYGIGSSYAYSGTVLDSTIGRFGEIGHTKISPESKKRCQCGSYGCLETEAAMWSILPEIKKQYPDINENEREFASLLNNMDLMHMPAITRALEYVREGLVNLHRLFYPDRIIFVGPFTENKQIFSKLSHYFKDAIPEYAKDKVELEVIKDGFRGCIFANAYPFFSAKLKNLLIAQSR